MTSFFSTSLLFVLLITYQVNLDGSMKVAGKVTLVVGCLQSFKLIPDISTIDF